MSRYYESRQCPSRGKSLFQENSQRDIYSSFLKRESLINWVVYELETSLLWMWFGKSLILDTPGCKEGLCRTPERGGMWDPS